MNGRFSLLGAAAAALVGGPVLAQPANLEASLRAADAQQRQAMAAGDVAAASALTHPSFLVNSPLGEVLTRDEMLARLKSGGLGTTRFDRTIEQVRIAGDVGVVMGHEDLVPTATSEAGRAFGVKPQQRRFTSVYRLEDGKWRLLARHLNNVTPPAAPSVRKP